MNNRLCILETIEPLKVNLDSAMPSKMKKKNHFFFIPKMVFFKKKKTMVSEQNQTLYPVLIIFRAMQ